MADKSITGLTAAGTITGAELIKIVQGGNSRKVDLTTVIAALAAVGVDGEDGRTILNGTGAPSGGTGVDGDFYLRTSNYVLYGPKTAGAWGSGVSLVGPAGADGADGADGLDGTDGRTVLNGSGAPGGGLGLDGDFYLNTTNYDLYGPKTAGAWGSPTSLLGTVGSDGKTILNGTVAPTTEGTDGDFYINTSTNFLYGPKASGTWPAGISLVGPAGTDGTDGVDGIDGVDGRTILYGTAAPTTEGQDGDFYIRTTTNFIYGPKAGGVWPAGTSLVGAAGTNGNTILYGTAAPTTEGNNGDFYIRTTTSFIYGPKAGGVWPAGTSLVGAAGTNGTNGTNGTDGKTVLNGSGVPSSGLGTNGDFYIDTTAWTIYGPKSGGAWGSATSLKALPDISTQTASYTLVLGDANDYVRMNVASANTLTVPKNSVVAFPVGTMIFIRQAGAGQTTIAPVDGTVTISTPETLKLRKQGSSASLIKVATDTWELTGDLELLP